MLRKSRADRGNDRVFRLVVGRNRDIAMFLGVRRQPLQVARRVDDDRSRAACGANGDGKNGVIDHGLGKPQLHAHSTAAVPGPRFWVPEDGSERDTGDRAGPSTATYARPRTAWVPRTQPRVAARS